MDDSDPDIRFDENGVCNHYHHALLRLETEYFPGPEGRAKFEAIAARIREEGAGKPYDCVLGLSGGADSSFVAVRAREHGLRPLAVHLDNGWNTETAVSNIEAILRGIDLDLYTHVIEWQEFRDVQRALFRASMANVEVATDHAIFALLYKVAAKFDVRYILTGSNVETETIMPDSWGYDARDARHIVAIKRRFGDPAVKLRTFPLLTPEAFLWHTFVRRAKLLPILNYGSYSKKEAVARMAAEFGYKPYARKHGESRFTRFFQEYYLVEKFGFDKRKAHFSSLIAAGQMTREEAFALLNQPMYRGEERQIDIDYVTKKLGFSQSEWDEIMQAPPGSYADYPNNAWMFDHSSPLVSAIRNFAKGETNRKAPAASQA
jgi:N-acetyl sugar amidotransferase